MFRVQSYLQRSSAGGNHSYWNLGGARLVSDEDAVLLVIYQSVVSYEIPQAERVRRRIRDEHRV